MTDDLSKLTDDDMKIATMLALRYGSVDAVYHMWRLGARASTKYPNFVKPKEKIKLSNEELSLMRKIQYLNSQAIPQYPTEYEYVDAKR